MSKDLIPFDKHPLRLSERTPKDSDSKLESLLNDPDKVALMESRSQIGASIGTIAATLGIPTNTFIKWVDRGKEETQKYDPDFAQTPHMQLWEILSKGWAEARTLAEAALSQRNPEKFLTSKASRMVGDDWVEEEKAPEDVIEKTTLQVGTSMIEAMKTLRAQGFSLDEIIDKDKMSLMVDPPKKKEQDILIKNKISLENPSLPESMGEANHTNPNSLDGSN